MPTALYPGTFDPVTYGHIDIARRAASIFPKLIAVVAQNPSKETFFSAEERLAMAQEALTDVDNIEVMHYDGLIVDCMRECGASFLIRGLRALSDFEYEFQMAFANRTLNNAVETVFLTPSAEYLYLNSTMVKQIALLGGDVGSFVPPCVQTHLRRRMRAGGASGKG